MNTVDKTIINNAIAENWAKLEQAVQQKLDAVLNGEADLNASTATAIVKFLETSSQLASDPSISRVDYSNIELPTFDDEEDEFGFVSPEPVTKTRAKSNTKEGL